MKTINSVVEQINNDRQMTNKRVSEIIASIFEAEDVNLMDVVFEENYIYYSEEGRKEFFVTKSDDDGDGFLLNFNIWDKEDAEEDVIESVVVTSIPDLYAAIAAICKFAENPYEVIIALSEDSK